MCCMVFVCHFYNGILIARSLVFTASFILFAKSHSCQIVIHSDGGICAECFCPCLEGVFKSANLIEVWSFPKVFQWSVGFCRIVAVCVHHFRSVLLNEYICPVALLATRIESNTSNAADFSSSSVSSLVPNSLIISSKSTCVITRNLKLFLGNSGLSLRHERILVSQRGRSCPFTLASSTA